jgi:hypothetical protein
MTTLPLPPLDAASLQAVIDCQSAQIEALEKQVRNYAVLVRWRDGLLADAMGDEFDVRTEEYQDDGSGRITLSADPEEITIDLSDEDDFVPARVVITRELPDGDVARFVARLQARKLRYRLEFKS